MRSPAFPFYPSDFLTGTDEMSSAEVGLYIRMLSYQWLKPEGGLPSDPAKIVRLARWESGELPVAVMRKFVASEDGLLRNPRLEQERQKRESYQKQQTELANRRWEKNGHAAPAPETTTKPAAARFDPPGLEEVRLYMAKVGFPESRAEAFIAHYEKMDWTIRGQKIRSWKACVRTWKIEWESKGRPGATTPASPQRPLTAAEKEEADRRLVAEAGR